jgi:predicted AlkP superfamily phosphohydrolase/phosphomutase
MVGIDGASWTQIDHFIKIGKMPNLEKIIQNGVRATLNSHFPFTSNSSWLSILTGTNSGKHGVPELGTKFSNELPILWEFLSKNSKKAIIVNDLSTYPPLNLDGIMISGGGSTPSNSKKFVYPDEINNEINSICENYIPTIPEEYHKFMKELNFEGAFAVMEKYDKDVANIFFHLTKNHQWELACFMLENPDVLHHNFWDKEKFLMKFYSWFDQIIGQIKKMIDDSGADLIIISDHGGGGVDKHFLPNTWLQHMGLVKFSQHDIVTKSLTKTKCTRDKLRSDLEKLHLRSIFSKITPKILKEKIPLHEDEVNFIDENKDKAFSKTYGTISINENDPIKRKELIDKIISGLLSLKDENKQIVLEAHKREEIFNGPFVERSSEIQFLLNEGYRWSPYLRDTSYLIPNNEYGDEVRVGDHRPEGILVAYGSNMKKGERLTKKIMLWDICPTIMHMFEVPIPSYMDGKPLKEIFHSESTYQSKNLEIVEQKIEDVIKSSNYSYTDEQEKEIEKNLRNLGYI